MIQIILMNKNKIIIIIALLIILTTIFLMSKAESGKIVSSQVSSRNEVVLTPASIPTPTPIIIDKNSNLEEETEKLTPEDFSEDFKNLKQEASN